jgi:hypothetical protein
MLLQSDIVWSPPFYFSYIRDRRPIMNMKLFCLCILDGNSDSTCTIWYWYGCWMKSYPCSSRLAWIHSSGLYRCYGFNQLVWITNLNWLILAKFINTGDSSMHQPCVQCVHVTVNALHVALTLITLVWAQVASCQLCINTWRKCSPAILLTN